MILTPLKRATKHELLTLLDWIISHRLDRDSYRRDLERQLSSLRFDALQDEVRRLIDDSEQLLQARQTTSNAVAILESMNAVRANSDRIAALNRRIDALMELAE